MGRDWDWSGLGFGCRSSTQTATRCSARMIQDSAVTARPTPSESCSKSQWRYCPTWTTLPVLRWRCVLHHCRSSGLATAAFFFLTLSCLLAQGPDSHYGTKGMRKVTHESSSTGTKTCFTFCYAAGNNNGTSVEDGQIPEVIFYT